MVNSKIRSPDSGQKQPVKFYCLCQDATGMIIIDQQQVNPDNQHYEFSSVVDDCGFEVLQADHWHTLTPPAL